MLQATEIHIDERVERCGKGERQACAGHLKDSFEYCYKLQLGLTNALNALVINAFYSDLKLLVPLDFNDEFT